MGSKIADLPGRGWFDTPGVQGDRTLAEQMRGLDLVLAEAPGKSVLDLACAEGMIGIELLRAGATLLHGVELVPNRMVAAQRNAAEWGDAATFWRDDVGLLEIDLPRDLTRRYDIVLALSIAHKLPRPVSFLMAAAKRCTGLLAIRLPAPVIQDRRSAFVPVDVVALLGREGFALEATPDGSFGEWIGLFRRQPCV